MKKYIGTKIVAAEPMHENEWLKGKNQETMNRDGYLIVYDNGYRSWSPKYIFEAAYREVSQKEYSLLNNLGFTEAA